VDAFINEYSNFGWRLYWKHLATGGANFHRISGLHT